MNDRFTKANDDLIGLGLPPRLVLLYGKLAYHAKSGKCIPKHSTLAREIGLKSKRSREHVLRLLKRLHQLRLNRMETRSVFELLSGTRSRCDFFVTSDATGKSHLRCDGEVT
jgi:hypothetical protein